MKRSSIALAAVLTVAAVPIASAAITDAQFPPRTVRDLIAICAPPENDPRLTGAINYCHGYAEGAVIVELAHNRREGRRLFCLPSPAPDSGSELGQFITWANAEPQRLDEPAVDGMFLYLAEKYPCAATAPARRRHS
ncbi:MAG: hypothetical protein JOZ42_00775 [Acetobacteraceae bacterium]|nr:hypothetical protein [Acetobacteraceae bacterium]